MKESLKVINELLVDIFNDILTIEQNALQESELKDVSITEIHTIETIGMYTQKTMSEVASDLRITMGTLTTAINNLVKKGYVERCRTEEDRRVVLVKLTRKGKLAYRIHDKFHSDMVMHTTDNLTEEEEKILTVSLKKLNDFFKATYSLKKE